MRPNRLYLFAGTSPAAHAARDELARFYPVVTDTHDADAIIVLGGDGTMLEALHQHMNSNKPIYGMNRGSVGFLMNPYRADDLPVRLEAAHTIALHPLRMTATDRDGKTHDAVAFNEVAVYRQTRQSAHLKLTVNGITRMDEMVGDGVLVATPAGSTAYNLSARGPIIPLGSNVLGFTPISPFRPRAWRGALLPDTAIITITNLDPDKRPVSVTADFTEVRDMTQVTIAADATRSAGVLFDPDHNLEERIFNEQFVH